MLGILVIANVNVMNHVILVNIQIMKIVNIEKRLVDKLVEECNENIDEAKLTEIALFEHKNECACYYTVFIVLSVIVLTICIGISTYFVYYKYMNRNKENVSVYGYVYQRKNY